MKLKKAIVAKMNRVALRAVVDHLELDRVDARSSVDMAMARVHRATCGGVARIPARGSCRTPEQVARRGFDRPQLETVPTARLPEEREVC